MLKLRFVEQKPDETINGLRSLVLDDAKDNWANLKYGGFDAKDTSYGFADLRMTHLGLTNSTYFGKWGTPAVTSAGTATTWWDSTVHKDSYHLYYGIQNRTATPKIFEAKFYLGGVENAWLDLQEMYGWDIARYYFEQGLTVGPDQSTRAEVTAEATVAARAEILGLVGEILAKRSYIIKYDAPTP